MLIIRWRQQWLGFFLNSPVFVFFLIVFFYKYNGDKRIYYCCCTFFFLISGLAPPVYFALALSVPLPRCLRCLLLLHRLHRRSTGSLWHQTRCASALTTATFADSSQSTDMSHNSWSKPVIVVAHPRSLREVGRRSVISLRTQRFLCGFFPGVGPYSFVSGWSGIMSDLVTDELGQ